jgi:hypothetical protein
MSDRDLFRVRVDKDFATNRDRLLIGRQFPGQPFEALIATGAEWRPTNPAHATRDDAGLWLPGGAWDAIRDYAHPGPSRAEVARLEEALAVERKRVDMLLARIATVVQVI